VKRWKIRLFALAALLLAGCPSAEIHDEVVTLRRLHANYRAATVAREDVPQETVDRIADKLDASFVKLEELTR